MDDRGAHVAEDELAVAGRELLQGSVLPDGGRPEVPAVRLTARLAEARRATTRYLHQVRHQPPPSRSNAPLLVLVPAHDDEATVGRTLQALLTSSRVPDRVVLLADGCTDRTEEIARRFARVTVMRVLDNTAGRAGALAQGWRRWQSGYDHVAVVDADTALAPDCLQELEGELWRSSHPGRVTARYTADRTLGSTAVARFVTRTLHPGAAAVLPGDRARVLGGQVSVYDADALRQVAAANGTPSPWDTTTPVPDQQLAADLRRADRQTAVSPTARAHAGPRLTGRALFRQHRAADEQTVRQLLHRTPGTSSSVLWRQQLGLGAQGAGRVLFLALLAATLLAEPSGWSWLWLAPLVLIPLEAALWLRLASSATAWGAVLTGSRTAVLAGTAVLAVLLATAGVGWQHVDADLQQRLLTVGWVLMAVTAGAQVLVLLARVLAPRRRRRT